ncbi:hypothetical protein [Priestia aryabhattai]|uniref:hypothetical protein n=1 Tax=Priestia aryabhattai TaxID=412384 RepID=UPI001C8E160C|nr:hypothetical protein [Priestia aryabhattai]MBY0214118.1 hypothetical protein [Priestia aryabhattai]
MNIDTKYLIRWGIPGWVFILFGYTSYLSIGNNIKNSLFAGSFTVAQLLGILVSLGFVGVVFGYLMHQIYFSLNWIFTNQSTKIMSKMNGLVQNQEIFETNNQESSPHAKYYKMEFNWQKQLLMLDEKKRTYIAERYAYLLSTIHGLGALLVSLVSSFIAVLVIAWSHHILNGLMLFYILFLIYLGFSVYKGFKYYSENLNHFQANFLNSFLAGEFTSDSNTSTE